MKHTGTKIIILVTVFLTIVAVILFFVLRKDKTISSYGDKTSATLPYLEFEYEGIRFNELHGYLSVEEPEDYVSHDTIVPLTKERGIRLRVTKKALDATSIRYMLFDQAAKRLYEEKSFDLSFPVNATNCIDFSLTNLIAEGEECRLFFYITLADGREVFYSTRVVYYEQNSLDRFLPVSSSLTDALLTKDTISLQQYMTFTGEQAVTNLSNVTLKSTIRQATWAGLEPKMASEKSIRLYELSSSQAEFSWLYTVETKENERTVLYDVEEYYSMRVRENKIYVLSYDRFTQERFAKNANCMGATSILLGIQSREDVSMKKTPDQKKVAFTVNQSIQYYNYSKNEMTEVFAFADSVAGLFIQEEWCEIKLLKMDEKGNLDFAVSGYHFSGKHEGECGLSLYYYDAEQNSLDEVAYIACAGGYEKTKLECGQILYMNEDNLWYFDFGGSLYSLDRKSLEYQKVAENVGYHTVVSKDGAIAAWEDEDGYSRIHILDMNTNVMKNLEISDEHIQSIGFIEHDFVYGVLAKDVWQPERFDDTGMLQELRIVNLDLEEQAKYSKPDVYIKEVVLEDYSAVIQCVRIKENDLFEVLPDDVLTSADHQENTDAVDLKISSSNMKFNYYYITFGKAISSSLFNQRSCRYQMKEPRLLTLTASKKIPEYRAYFAGRLVSLTDRPSVAIQSVFDYMGVVVKNGEVIWNRGTRNLYVMLTMPELQMVQETLSGTSAMESALQTIKLFSASDSDVNVYESLQMGQSALEIMQSMFGDRTVDLGGCTSAQVLYYINLRHPVLALSATGYPVLLYAYNSNQIFIYDSQTGEKKALEAKEEADLFFASAGYRFISYAD